MIVISNSKEIKELLGILIGLKKRAKKDNNEKATYYIEMVEEIVKEWNYDNSQYEFRSDHYRQAVSFLLRISEETPYDEMPEYFQGRFYETMKNYKALEHIYKEREGKNNHEKN